MIRAIASLHIKRPGGSRTRVTELVSASLEYSPEIIPTAIVSGYATAHPSIVGWTINAATIEDDVALSEAVAAAKGSERLEIEVTLGDGYELVGDAYVASIGRGGSVGSRFETNISLLGAGALTETEEGVSNVSASLSMPAPIASGTVGLELGVSGAITLPATQISAQVDREAEASGSLTLGSLAIAGEVDADIIREVSGSLVLGALEAAGQVDREAEVSGSLTLAALSLDGTVSASDFAIQDTFTDTDGTNLVDHTPDVDTVGGGWSGSTAFEIQSNRLVTGSTSTSLFVDIDSGIADKTIQATLHIADSGGNLYGGVQLYGRANSARTESWSFRLESNGNWQLWRDTTTIDSGTITVAEGDFVLKLVFNGTTIEAYIDDVLKASTTSSTYQTNTWCHVRNYALVNGAYLDDYEVS